MPNVPAGYGRLSYLIAFFQSILYSSCELLVNVRFILTRNLTRKKA